MTADSNPLLLTTLTTKKLIEEITRNVRDTVTPPHASVHVSHLTLLSGTVSYILKQTLALYPQFETREALEKVSFWKLDKIIPGDAAWTVVYEFCFYLNLQERTLPVGTIYIDVHIDGTWCSPDVRTRAPTPAESLGTVPKSKNWSESLVGRFNEGNNSGSAPGKPLPSRTTEWFISLFQEMYLPPSPNEKPEPGWLDREETIQQFCKHVVLMDPGFLTEPRRIMTTRVTKPAHDGDQSGSIVAYVYPAYEQISDLDDPNINAAGFLFSITFHTTIFDQLSPENTDERIVYYVLNPSAVQLTGSRSMVPGWQYQRQRPRPRWSYLISRIQQSYADRMIHPNELSVTNVPAFAELLVIHTVRSVTLQATEDATRRVDQFLDEIVRLHDSEFRAQARRLLSTRVQAPGKESRLTLVVSVFDMDPSLASPKKLFQIGIYTQMIGDASKVERVTGWEVSQYKEPGKESDASEKTESVPSVSERHTVLRTRSVRLFQAFVENVASMCEEVDDNVNALNHLVDFVLTLNSPRTFTYDCQLADQYVRIAVLSEDNLPLLVFETTKLPF